jgi:serine/threonine-protein kinase
VQDPPERFDEDEAWLDSLAPVAENLAGGAAVDWDAADSSQITASHKAVLQQLRAIARIARAHARFAREADPPLATTDADGELRTWGQLIIRSHVGRGSFGDVYRAWDPRLDREVALKLLTPPATAETAQNSTVISEGRALARVRHLNVVTVYGADQVSGRIGVWMEFVEGRTLAQRIAAEGPLTPAETAAIGADLARALAAVHKAALLHRDVKAQNVMCEAGGRIVLMDFGTAIPHETQDPAGDTAIETASATDAPPGAIAPRRAALAGTPLYLAPEVLEGAAQTPRTDIYALGVVLFHALTGSFPVTGPTLREVHARHREGQRTPLSAARSGLPPALVSVVDRALAPDPAERCQTADEIAEALDAAVEEGKTVPARAFVGRTTWVVAVAATLATMGVAAWLTGALPFRRTGTVGPKGPDLVLIASFENSSGDPRLGAVVERAVAEAVTATRVFAVAPQDRVNSLRGYMRRAPDSTLDATSALEAARRDGGVRAVITGSVARRGDQQAVEVRIVAPVCGSTVATVKEASVGSEVARMLVALRAGVAGALDSQRKALPAPIAEHEHVTTASFEALRTYTAGRAEFERGNKAGAAELFLQATTIDPVFALAYTWLGWSRYSPGGTPDNVTFAKGVELAQASSPEERLWARGSHLFASGDNQGANAAFWDLLQLDPLHYWALSNLDYNLWGNLAEYEWVISYWEQQADARPNDLRTLYRTATALFTFEAHAGRAMPYFDRFLEATRDVPDGGQAIQRAFARLAPAWHAWACGRVKLAAERMAPVCDAPAGGPKNVQRIHEACIRLSVALGLLQRADSHLPGVWDQSYIALYRGDRDTLMRLYESEPQMRRWIGPFVGIFDYGGDRGEIRILRGFRYDHFAELAKGASPATLELFAKRWRMAPSSSGTHLQFAETYADALVRVGDRDRAIKVQEAASSNRRALLPQDAFNWVWARNSYAELLRRLGRDAEAEPVERDLLSMLSEADADHVIAAKLRARYGGSAPRAH